MAFSFGLNHVPSLHSRVAVTTSFASVNNVEMLQRELEASSKSFDTGSKFTLGQRCQLVEERLNKGRVDDLDENGENEAEKD